MPEAPEPAESDAANYVKHMSGGFLVQVGKIVMWPMAALAVVMVLAVVAAFIVFPERQQPSTGQSAGRPTTTTAPANRLPQLGDQRAVDPCALIDPTPVSKYGNFAESNDYGEFNRCDLIDSATNADLELELDLGAQAVAPDIEIQAGESDSTGCGRIIPLPGKYRILITAKNLPADRMCEIAQAFATGTGTVLTSLGGGLIPRREPLSPASLAMSKACDLLDDTTVRQVLGFAVGAEQGFADWSCQWSGAGPTTVTVRFERTNANGDLGQPGTFLSRTGYADTSTANECVIHLRYRTYPDDQQFPTDDLADVQVDGDRTAAQLCTPARALATEVARRLR